MTQIYRDAAIRHEKIDGFPKADEPEHYTWGHCSYAGFTRRSFCHKWKLLPKEMEIVGENA